MGMSKELIDALGGTSAVARSTGQSGNTVSNWKERGVPWKWRPLLAQLAERQNVPVPEDFLDPTAAAA